MKVTVTNYAHMTEVSVDSYIDEKKSARLRRKGFKWSRDNRVWYSYESGENAARDVFDEAEFEVVSEKSPITVYKRDGRTELDFYEIPDEDERAQMKKNGFRWDAGSKIWYSTDENAEDAIRQIFPECNYIIVVKDKNSENNDALYKVIDALTKYAEAGKEVFDALRELEMKSEPLCKRVERELFFSGEQVENLNKAINDGIAAIRKMTK